jgi:hypothetical protein
MPKYLTPTESADRRTLNRLRENGPIFNVGRETPVVCFGFNATMMKARLLHSLKTDWVGWVPAIHIRIDSLEDVGWNDVDLQIFMRNRKEQ